jgi:beta-lactam-binding protein with PASTA domain
VGLRAATVPSVTGILEKQAVAAVKAAGLTVQEVFQAEPDCALAGRVVLQSPDPGTEVALGSTVTLTIGQKPGNICP